MFAWRHSSCGPGTRWCHGSNSTEKLHQSLWFLRATMNPTVWHLYHVSLTFCITKIFFFFFRGVLVLLSLLWHNYLHIRETLMHSYSFWKLVQGKKDLLHNFALQVLQTFFTHETQALQKQGKNSLDFRGGRGVAGGWRFHLQWISGSKASTRLPMLRWSPVREGEVPVGDILFCSTQSDEKKQNKTWRSA